MLKPANQMQDNAQVCNGIPQWIAIGIAPRGIVAIGIVPMGVITVGAVGMGIINISLVGMGALSACFVGMGLWGTGVQFMSL